MNGVKETALTVCIVMVAIELIARFGPKNSMLNFVRGLVLLLLLVSGVASLFRLDLDLSLGQARVQEENRELVEYVEQQAELAVQEEWKRSVEGLLAIIQLEAKKIEVNTDIAEDSSIVLTKVTVAFAYETEAQRGKLLLEKAFGEETQVEVLVHGQ